MIDFHPAALAELKASLAWYLDRSSGAASAFLVSVRERLAVVERDPERYARDKRGFRSGPVSKYPFVIIYRETNKGVRVVAVAHTARRPGYWRDRV
jgi:toxin ParE1/3/4